MAKKRGVDRAPGRPLAPEIRDLPWKESGPGQAGTDWVLGAIWTRYEEEGAQGREFSYVATVPSAYREDVWLFFTAVTDGRHILREVRVSAYIQAGPGRPHDTHVQRQEEDQIVYLVLGR